ncbi:MAG: EF-hand domain-containing protein [Bacteroidota bacterium]
MATAFQKKKLTYFFDIMDVDGNGTIQLDDFSDMAEKVRQMMHFEEGSKEHKRIVEKATRFFHALIKDIEPSNQQEITKEEWLSFFDLEKMPKEMLVEYKEIVFNFMFDFFDQNRDGYISRKEYEDFYKIFGINTQFLDEAFPKLDSSNAYKLHRYDVMDAVEDFFISDDEEDSGNWIFGNWESLPHQRTT